MPEIQSFDELFTRSEFVMLREYAEIDLDIRYKDQWESIQMEIKDTHEIARTRELIIRKLILYNYASLLIKSVYIAITDPDFGKNTGNDTSKEVLLGVNFGIFARTAGESVEAFPHGKLHERNIDNAQKLNIILLASGLNDPTGLFTVVAGLKPATHDAPQALMEYKKSFSTNETIQIVNPKDDHKEIAAATVIMLRPYFQKYGHLSEELSRKLVAILAADISAHDELDAFDVILSGEEKVSAVNLDEQELYTRYNDGSLDRLSILPYQWLLIVKAKHAEMKIRYDKDMREKGQEFDLTQFGEFGIGIEHEARFYQDIIRMLQENTSAFKWTTVEEYNRDHKELVMFASVFNVPDTMEMIMPGGAIAYGRMINVPVNKDLPLAMPERDKKEALMIKHPTNFNVSAYMRKQAEYLANARMIMRSPVVLKMIEDLSGDTPLFVKFMRNTVLYHMAQSHKFLMRIIEGEPGVEALNYEFLNRVVMLGEKALRKGEAGYLIDEYHKQMKTVSDKKAVEAYINKNMPLTLMGVRYKKRFLKRVSHIREQIMKTIQILREKKGPRGEDNDGKIFVYSPKDKKQIEINFEIHWNEVCRIFGITNSIEQDTYRSDMLSQRTFNDLTIQYPMLHSPGSDPLGDLADAKVLNDEDPAVVALKEFAAKQSQEAFERELLKQGVYWLKNTNR